jgi:signal transduction histidine kinase
MALSLGMERSDGPEERMMFERGTRSVARVASIVDALLRFARAGAKPEPGARTPIAPVVEDVFQGLAEGAAQAAVELHLESVPRCAVPCTPGILQSLLENLLRNAIKHMGDRPAGARRVTVRINERGQRVRFEVEDTGPGVPPDIQPSLFEPYVRGRTRQPGIGLGLATVKRVVIAHGGSVGVRSTLGVGSCFWFELPRFEDPLYEPEPRASESLH